MFNYLRGALTGKTTHQNLDPPTDSSIPDSSACSDQAEQHSPTNAAVTRSDTSDTTAMNGFGKMMGMVPKMFVSKPKRQDIVQELRDLTTKFPYSRPAFLELVSREEMQLTLLHTERLITLPKRNCLPGNTGYAECTNAGKSIFNEDQASAVELKLGITDHSFFNDNPLQLDPLKIFAVFDGHAGADVAVTVSHELPHRVKERLCNVIIDLKHALLNNVQEITTPQTLGRLAPPSPKRRLTFDRLVTGALEAAFHDMDENLIEDSLQYSVKGGCAAVLALFYAGKLFVANAGDCRAVLVLSGEPIPMSTDFTPESERRRLQQIAEQHPDLLGNEFCSTQFVQRVTRKDVGTMMLYRDSRMEGWANREVKEEDLRFPLVIGEGKRARLLATIGLTRGIGDHNLKVFDSNIKIKPFLSSTPEVKVRDLRRDNLVAEDVLILGSDGLWDVMTNQRAAEIVNQVLSNLPATDNTRYIAAAQCLVSEARGEARYDRRDIWLLKGTMSYASHDDVTCMVIPLLHNTLLNNEPLYTSSHSTTDNKLYEPPVGLVKSPSDTRESSRADVNCPPADTLQETATSNNDNVNANLTNALKSPDERRGTDCSIPDERPEHNSDSELEVEEEGTREPHTAACRLPSEPGMPPADACVSPLEVCELPIDVCEPPTAATTQEPVVSDHKDNTAKIDYDSSMISNGLEFNTESPVTKCDGFAYELSDEQQMLGDHKAPSDDEQKSGEPDSRLDGKCVSEEEEGFVTVILPLGDPAAVEPNLNHGESAAHG